MENRYYDQLTREYNEKISEKTAKLWSKKKNYPRTSNYHEAAIIISPVVGLIFGILRIGESSFLGGFILGVFCVCAVVWGFYGLVCAVKYAHNKSIDREYEKIERALLAEKEEKLKEYRADIRDECRALIEEYNRSTKTSKVYTWMDSLWSTAIVCADDAEYLLEITPSLTYTVREDRIDAEILLGGGRRTNSSFEFRTQNVTPVVRSSDAYRRIVERAGFAMFLYKKYKYDLLGTETVPGRYAYAPGQTVRDKSTRARISVDSGQYPFAAESYHLCYRAANPKHHPPEVLVRGKEKS